jgi:hypothetical protein
MNQKPHPMTIALPEQILRLRHLLMHKSMM